MSAAFAECYLCPAKIVSMKPSTASDAEVIAEFTERGWTVGPTRCPSHVGLEEAPPLVACPSEHDPQPMTYRGIQMAQVTFGRSGAAFQPRSGYCQWAQHYGSDKK